MGIPSPSSSLSGFALAFSSPSILACAAETFGRVIWTRRGLSTTASSPSEASSLCPSLSERTLGSGFRLTVRGRADPRRVVERSLGILAGGTHSPSICSRSCLSLSEGLTDCQTLPSSLACVFARSSCISRRSMSFSRFIIPCMRAGSASDCLSPFDAAISWASRSMRYSSLVSSSFLCNS